MKIELDEESKEAIKQLTDAINNLRKTIYPLGNVYERHVNYLERNEQNNKK